MSGEIKAHLINSFLSLLNVPLKLVTWLTLWINHKVTK